MGESGKAGREIQNVQKTIFKEKKKIIENSLFGVDINPNSVKICRLRLWIELLKNSYYTEESDYKELQEKYSDRTRLLRKKIEYCLESGKKDKAV